MEDVVVAFEYAINRLARMKNQRDTFAIGRVCRQVTGLELSGELSNEARRKISLMIESCSLFGDGSLTLEEFLLQIEIESSFSGEGDHPNMSNFRKIVALYFLLQKKRGPIIGPLVNLIIFLTILSQLGC